MVYRRCSHDSEGTLALKSQVYRDVTMSSGEETNFIGLSWRLWPLSWEKGQVSRGETGLS